MRAALVERFLTVQGEGRWTGRLAYFIRFAGCNLDCHFADGSVCDTPWRKARKKISIRRLAHEALKAAGTDGHGMVVLTGGEPTMSPAFDDLVQLLKDRRMFVAVESNGTIWRDGLNAVDWLTVSPKFDAEHPNPTGNGAADPRVDQYVRDRINELRYVITPDSGHPVWMEADDHYVSPATIADGSGAIEFDGFVPGAVERCMEIVKLDPRWKISIQSHKVLGQR